MRTAKAAAREAVLDGKRTAMEQLHAVCVLMIFLRHGGHTHTLMRLFACSPMIAEQLGAAEDNPGFGHSSG